MESNNPESQSNGNASGGCDSDNATGPKVSDSCVSAENKSSCVTAEASTVAWWHFHRRLYDWVLHWAKTPYGGWALFGLSFAESSFFPVPPDVLLAPLTLGARHKWLQFSLLCSVASVFGGILGYCIGYFMWDQIGSWVFANMAWAKITPENFEKFKALYDKWDFWIVFLCGFTPLPYKVCTITAGIAAINFPAFLIGSTISRSARFFMVSGLFAAFGPKIQPFVDKYFNLLSIVFVLLLFGGFALLKYIH